MSYFDQDKANEYDPIPEGAYAASVHNVTCDLTKPVPTVSVQYKLQSNRRVFQNFKFDDKGKKWLTWQMGVLGLTEIAKTKVKDPATATAFDAAKSYVDAAPEILNKVVELQISHNLYNGKTYERVKLLSGPEGVVASGSDMSEDLPF